MKKVFTIIAGVLQFISIILFIGIIKGIFALIKGEIDVYTFIGVIVLALIFQGVSYGLSHKHPEEYNKANQTINHSDKRYGLFALLFLIIAIALFFTFAFELGTEKILLQIAIVIIGVLSGIIIFKNNNR
jgi:hypothetical protein